MLQKGSACLRRISCGSGPDIVYFPCSTFQSGRRIALRTTRPDRESSRFLRLEGDHSTSALSCGAFGPFAAIIPNSRARASNTLGRPDCSRQFGRASAPMRGQCAWSWRRCIPNHERQEAKQRHDDSHRGISEHCRRDFPPLPRHRSIVPVGDHSACDQ
jgi:hypothetical protein